MTGDGGGVRVKVGVQLGSGVGESNKGGVGTEGVNGFQVGEDVGVKLGAGVEVKVEVAMLFPSARDSDKPPSSKPIEARAIRIPRNTCDKFFIAGSFQATFPRSASGR